MKNINLNNFIIDDKIIAKEIYSGSKREIIQEGVILGDEITGELNDFLTQYSKFIELELKKVFFRIDCYFDEKNLFILDVNTSFVDGWGNSLNFYRSVGEETEKLDNLSVFPKNFLLLEDIYRPEFELCLKELKIATGSNYNENDNIKSQEDLYIYGSSNEVGQNIFPYNGRALDDKTFLANFSRKWTGSNIKIPEFILPEDSSYKELPDEIVLKVSNKDFIRPDLRNKVIIGKGKSYNELWKSGKMVAQQKIETQKNSNGENMQLIIMAIGNFDLGVKGLLGYVQNSTRKIINDNSKQSPLILKN